MRSYLSQVLPLTSYTQFPIIAGSLKCENLSNPLGIDAATPRLTWRLHDNRMGAIQTAYQLFVSTDSSEVIKGAGNAWQTGKIYSPGQAVIYKGKTLLPFTRYYWTVRIWDKDARPSLLSKTGLKTVNY